MNEIWEADQPPPQIHLTAGRWNIKYENEGELGGGGPGIPPKVFPPEQWLELDRGWGRRGLVGQKLTFYFRPQTSLPFSLILFCNILHQIRELLRQNFLIDNWKAEISGDQTFN